MALTYEDIVRKYKKETHNEHNLKEWHDLGYKGQGIKVLNLEQCHKHGKSTFDVIVKTAPRAKVYWCEYGLGNSGGKVTYFGCEIGNDQDDEILYLDYTEFKEFIKDIDIINYSRGGKFGEEFENLLLDNCICITSAGNDGYLGLSGAFSGKAWDIGAVQYLAGNIRRETYSSVGKDLDFVFFHYEREGTSFSSPTCAGTVAVVKSKYRKANEEQLYQAFKSISVDLGAQGFDESYGYGLPVLPENGKIDILEEVEMDNRLYSVEEMIEELEKYDKREFHIHHTYIPDVRDFNGKNHVALNEAMKRYHVRERNFIDIAQHVTLFPDGNFLIGRDFSLYPNSSSGSRPDGTSWNKDYVFMIENVGNFDREEVPDIVWENNVKIAAYFIENTGTVYFHRQMDPKKSCPGNKWDYKKFMDDVKTTVEKSKPHWAKIHRENLIRKGIIVHEERYDDFITRGEIFTLLDRITDNGGPL